MPYPGLLHPEPLPLQQATADPYLHRRYSDRVLAQSVWVGCVFCAIPNSEELRRPDARWVHYASNSLVPATHFPECAVKAPSQMCHISPLES